MLDQVMDLVKQHLGNNQEVASVIPQGQQEAVQHEVANGINDGLTKNVTSGGFGGMLSSLTGGGAQSDFSSTISNAVAERLKGKFGLSEDAIRKITSAIPGIIQKIQGKF